MSLRKLEDALNTHWKVTNKFLHYISNPFSLVSLKIFGVRAGTGLTLYGTPMIQKHRHATIRLGSNCSMRSWKRSNPLIANQRCVLSARSSQSEIIIGDEVRISSSAVVSESSIVIGDRVLIGANCNIVDTDFHPLSADERKVSPQNGMSKPITIGNDVFIGMNCIITKGTEIGDGCVVGAGSVVSGSFPDSVIIAGNPARIIRKT